MRVTIPINPMGTVRTTSGMIKRIKYKLYGPEDKKALKVIEYLSYKNAISWETKAQIQHKEPWTGPIELNLTCFIPMPDSWSEKKKRTMEGKRHTQKPDRDNLEKGVCDALNKIVWKDDGQVCDGRTSKYWSRTGRIEIEIKEIS